MGILGPSTSLRLRTECPSELVEVTGFGFWILRLLPVRAGWAGRRSGQVLDFGLGDVGSLRHFFVKVKKLKAKTNNPM